MLKKQLLIILILISMSIIPGFAQSDMSYSSFHVEVAPYMAFPLTEDIDYFGMSIGSQMKAGFTMPFIPSLNLGPEAGYGMNLLAGSHGDNLSTITAGLFVRFSPYLAPWLTVNIFGNGGYYYSFLNNETDQSGSNPYVGGGIGLSVLFGKTKFLSVGIEGAYRNYLGFFQEIGITASGTFHLGKKITPITKTPLIIEQIEKPLIAPLRFENYTSEALFPTLLKYYNQHSFGSVEITNPNSFPLKEVSVSFNINKYMDNKKECISIPNINAGETVEVDLYALFNSSILELYEKTIVSAILQAEYTANNETIIDELPVTVDILDRNALIWDDDRKAAAFVTAKDPVVMKFAKNVISIVDISGAINTNLYRGIALFTALNTHGMIYSIDPASSYADFAESTMAIDYLQYPRQTLDYKSGDCDDLTVLNAALFESLGIPAAFVTVPGHIFLAFSLDIPYADAGRVFINQEDLIDNNGMAWLPLEITQIKDGFLTAWDTAAREWRSAEANGQTGFFPVQEAWNTYESVAFFETTDIDFPEKEILHDAYQDEIQKFIGIQLAPQIAALKARLDNSSRPYRVNNSLGILFARYGRHEEAGLQFTEGLSLAPDFKPILTNMGNLQFILKQYNLSLDYYNKVADADETDAKIFISLALTYRELGEHAETLRNYNIAKQLRPELAEKYKFLAPGSSESGRAADVSVSLEDLIWVE